MVDDDEIIGFDEILAEVSEKLNALVVRLDQIEKDLLFVKEKTDHIGKKIYWVDNKLDQLISK